MNENIKQTPYKEDYLNKINELQTTIMELEYNLSREKEDYLNKINELQTTIMELEYNLCIEKEEKHKEIENNTKTFYNTQRENENIIEKLRNNAKKSCLVINDLTQQKNNYIELYKQESDKKKIIESKLQEFTLRYEEANERIQIYKLEYMNENQRLQEELKIIKESLNNEIYQNNTKENLISELYNRVNCIKDKENTEEELQNKLKILDKQLEVSEKQRKELQVALEKYEYIFLFPKDCENCLKLNKNIDELSNELINLKKELEENKIIQIMLIDLKEHQLFQDNENKNLLQDIQVKNDKIKELTENLQKYEGIIEKLNIENKEIAEECSELKHRILNLTKNNEILEREITDIKCKNITARKLEKIRLDDIDFSLENYLSEQRIENLFVKLAHGVYLYGTKQVNISLRNDNRLICRIGGGYMPIDQFLKLNQNTEIEEMSKYVKKQSLFLSQGASPIRGKRSLSNTPENNSKKSSPKENKAYANFENKIIDKLKLLYPLREKNFTPISRKNKHK